MHIKARRSLSDVAHPPWRAVHVLHFRSRAEVTRSRAAIARTTERYPVASLGRSLRLHWTDGAAALSRDDSRTVYWPWPSRIRRDQHPCQRLHRPRAGAWTRQLDTTRPWPWWYWRAALATAQAVVPTISTSRSKRL